jgi:signal recognition particle receptor subunit beta
MWHELSKGAIGAVVLVDTRRLDKCFAAIDFFEQRDTPFMVVVNTFDGRLNHPLEDVRTALNISPEVPMAYCDARVRVDVQNILVQLVEYALLKALQQIPA